MKRARSTEKIVEKTDFEELIEKSKTAICIDKLMLEDAGFTEKEIKNIYEKMGRSDLLGE